MAWLDGEEVRGGYLDPRLIALPGTERMLLGARRGMPLPPIHHLFGLRPVSASPVSVTFSMPCSPWLQSGVGVFFAGTAALVADAPLGGAVMAPLGPGKIVVTADLSMSFLRPVGVESGQLVARARPIEIGKRLGLGEALVEDGLGRLVAHATTRCFVSEVDLPPSEGPVEIPVVEDPVYETPDPYLRPVPDGLVSSEFLGGSEFVAMINERGHEDRPLAPFAQLFGMSDVGAEEGRFWSSMVSSPWVSSPAGTVYGGVLAYFADTVLTGAIWTTLGPGETAATLDLKVQFLRPAMPDGRPLHAEARVLHRGRSFAAAQAEVTNADGKVAVLAYSSATIREGGSWGSLVVADEA